MNPLAKKVSHFTFNRRDAEALVRRLFPESGNRSAGPSQVEQHHYICVATNGVPARNGSTLGKADVAMYSLAPSGANVTIGNANQNITVYNLAATAVATGSYIIIEYINGYWIVVWEECA
jgi:hypothetical protein